MVGKAYPNLRIVGSYWVAEDGKFKHYEMIMVDPFANTIRNDGKMNWICAGKFKRREARGLTSSGRKARGMRGKGMKRNGLRPSRAFHKKKKRTLSLRNKR